MVGRICDFVTAVGTVVACEAAAAADGTAARGRGGRNGFFVAAEWGVLLLDADGENERGTVRVMPSARLDPCP